MPTSVGTKLDPYEIVAPRAAVATRVALDEPFEYDVGAGAASHEEEPS
jgi:hypothetical protein